jgi:hypothetical protein
MTNKCAVNDIHRWCIAFNWYVLCSSHIDHVRSFMAQAVISIFVIKFSTQAPNQNNKGTLNGPPSWLPIRSGPPSQSNSGGLSWYTQSRSLSSPTVLKPWRYHDTMISWADGKVLHYIGLHLADQWRSWQGIRLCSRNTFTSLRRLISM